MNLSTIARKDAVALHTLQVIAKPITKLIDKLLETSKGHSVFVAGIKR